MGSGDCSATPPSYCYPLYVNKKWVAYSSTKEVYNNHESQHMYMCLYTDASLLLNWTEE